MLTFYPEFDLKTSDSDLHLIIALDASHSMQGAPFTEAKQVALLLLGHLPDTCSFNVLMFGSTFEEVFVASERKSNETLAAAEEAIQKCSPDLGGTLLER